MNFLEEAWTQREEERYKTIFGNVSSLIAPLTFETFKQYNCKTVDPRWLTHGVFKSEPTATRKTWAYVTSGMSNPWWSDVCEAYSGLGIEFVMETHEECSWAIEVLQTLMAYNILLSIGKFENFTPFDYGDYVPLSLSTNIQTMMFTYPVNFPDNFLLQSGSVDLLQVVGITKAEKEMAKKHSSNELKSKLVDITGGLVTDKERSCII